MFVELPEELATAGAVQDALKQVLQNKAAYTSLVAPSRKEASIKFGSIEEIKKAENALKEHFGERKARMMLI